MSAVPDSVELAEATEDQPDEHRREPLVGQTPIEAALGMMSDPETLALIYSEAYLLQAEYQQACLAEEGFGDYTVEPWPPPVPTDFLRGGDPPFAEEGYGEVLSLEGALALATEPSPTNPLQEANREFGAGLTEPEMRAFHRSRSRCQQEAWEVYPLPESYLEVVAADIRDLHTAALSSPIVQSAWSQWSACMAEEGYRFVDRDDAIAAVQHEINPYAEPVTSAVDGGSDPDPDAIAALRGALPDLRRVELRIATADAACSAKTSLGDVIQQELFTKEQAWLDENADRVALLAAEQREKDFWYNELLS